MAAKGINYGQYAFLGGLVIAVILGVLSGFVPENMVPILKAVLFLFGIVVGLLNVSEKEVSQFLLATVALLLAVGAFEEAFSSAFALMGDAGTMAAKMVVGFAEAFKAFIAPAAFIVAIQAVYKLAQPD